jgi:hypothetical protein
VTDADSAAAPWSAQVHQATGMIVAQTGVPTPEALVLLIEHADAHDLTVGDAATEVLKRRLRFNAK